MSDEQEHAGVPEPKPGENISAEQHAKYHWGAPISEVRQVWLADLAERQREWVVAPGAERGASPFKRLRLTGADACWLHAQAERNLLDVYDAVPMVYLEHASLNNAYLEGADLRYAHLEGAFLGGAHLQRADLREAHLESAILAGANLEEADLREAHLESAMLTESRLERANLREAHLEEADLEGARLDGAILQDARLGGAKLSGAHLEQADLVRAHLERTTFYRANLNGAHLNQADMRHTHLGEASLSGTDLSDAVLEEAFLVRARLNSASRLNGARLAGACFDQVTFDNVNLSVVDWGLVPVLGDEVTARNAIDMNGQPKDFSKRRDDYTAAVRANRVLAVALRGQGLNEDADRFAYRAQVLQRQVLRRQGLWGQWAFSLLLSTLAGYGYRLGRIVRVYAVVVIAFALAFLASDVVAGQAPLSLPTALDALQISLNAVHGRVFFAQFSLDTVQSWIATTESIVGIVVEGVFVAMLMQRFFTR